jgi:hypothetical protein
VVSRFAELHDSASRYFFLRRAGVLLDLPKFPVVKYPTAVK